ncbi:MAG: c-type cytochrome biogenesis protein CcmI [Pseudomonadota bacterium]
MPFALSACKTDCPRTHRSEETALFWLISSIAVIAVSLILWRFGLGRSSHGAARPEEREDLRGAAYDLEVYRDQLSELDRDLARGTLSAAEAERAKLEIQRRILAADKALGDQVQEASGSAPGTLYLGLAVLAMVAASYATYAVIGAPGARDLPLASRVADIDRARAARASQAEVEAARAAPVNPPPEDIAAEVAELRQVMETRTEDGEGLAILVRTEASLGNFRAARLAQGRLLNLLQDRDDLAPETLARAQADLAELMILAAGGFVSPEAETALRSALALDPNLGSARYSLGLMYAQQGRPDLAFPIWQRLLGDSRPDDPWLGVLQRDIEAVAIAAGVDPALVAMAAPGPASLAPSMDPAAAIANLPEAERQAAIEGMVERLSGRLAAEGGTAEDWARLIRALAVLDREPEARAILDEARDVFAESPRAIALIEAAAATILAPGTEPSSTPGPALGPAPGSAP